MNLPSTPALLQQQKANYQTVIEACNVVPRCVGVTLWDFTDKVRVHRFSLILIVNNLHDYS